MEPSDESLALLAKLSSKPGVQSTLILSRSDGAIVRSEGFLANGTAIAEEDNVRRSREDIARVVWKYIKATDGLVEELDGHDELRLLRIRSKKNEIVIVPSSKFLLVIIHDTPPA